MKRKYSHSNRTSARICFSKYIISMDISKDCQVTKIQQLIKTTYFPSSSVNAGAVPAFLASSNSFSLRQSSRLFFCPSSVLAAILFSVPKMLFESRRIVLKATSLPISNLLREGWYDLCIWWNFILTLEIQKNLDLKNF